jgi:hypothetical protein
MVAAIELAIRRLDGRSNVKAFVDVQIGPCGNCGKHSYIMPLHGERGGRLMCPICVGEWNAKHTRRRKFGRIVIKAMQLYLENGGRFGDLRKFEQDLACASLGLGHGPLGYGADTIGSEVGDITSELLADVLQLTHPDHHPAERCELATRVMQDLLALKPFVFPAPKPKPARPIEPKPRDSSANSHKETLKESSRPAYPCELCAETVPYFYCDPCKAEYEKRRNEERERKRAKQRRQYASRQQRRRWRRPSRLCDAGCGAEIKTLRKDAKYCSAACRQRAHRQRITDKYGVAGDALTSRDSAEAQP